MLWSAVFAGTVVSSFCGHCSWQFLWVLQSAVFVGTAVVFAARAFTVFAAGVLVVFAAIVLMLALLLPLFWHCSGNVFEIAVELFLALQWNCCFH